MSSTAVLWFQPSALRCHHNAAFNTACASADTVIPIYTPSLDVRSSAFGLKDKGHGSVAAVDRLAGELEALGAPLYTTDSSTSVKDMLEDVKVFCKEVQAAYFITSTPSDPEAASLYHQLDRELSASGVQVKSIASGLVEVNRKSLSGAMFLDFVEYGKESLEKASQQSEALATLTTKSGLEVQGWRTWKTAASSVSGSKAVVLPSREVPVDDLVASIPLGVCRAAVIGLPSVWRAQVLKLRFGGQRLAPAERERLQGTCSTLVGEWLAAEHRTELWNWQAIPKAKPNRGSTESFNRENSSASFSSSTSVDLETSGGGSVEEKEAEGTESSNTLFSLIRYGCVDVNDLITVAHAKAAAATKETSSPFSPTSRAILLLYLEAAILYAMFMEYSRCLVKEFPDLLRHPARVSLQPLPWCSSALGATSASLGVAARSSGPTIIEQCLVDPSKRQLATAFVEGRTGYPTIDASIACLRTTGWLPWQLCQVLATFWTRYLQLPWDVFASYLSSQAEELDFATSAVLVQAWNSMLVDPWFSLVAPHEALNPASERHIGPLFEKGLPGFIRHWLPSLAPLSNSFIIRPWRAPPSMQSSVPSVYRSPILTQAQARREALAVAMRYCRPGFDESTDVQKHGVLLATAMPKPFRDELSLTHNERLWGLTGQFPLLVDEDVEILLSEENIDGQEGWKMVNSDKKRNLKVWMDKGSHHKTVVAKAILTDISAEEAFMAIASTAAYASWDRTWAEIKQFGRINSSNEMLYLLADTPPAPFSAVVTQRDFCQVRNMVCYPDEGLYVIVWRNAEYPSAVSKKKSVRGETIGVIGFVVRQISKHETEVVFSTSADMKGKIPQFLVNFVAARTPKKWVDRLKDYCKKQKK